ncbi:MAG: phosphodiester glycosidase family protein [Chitinophagales bacterium]
MRRFSFIIINYSLLIFNCADVSAQLKWTNVDSLYQPLPKSVHIYFTNQPMDTGTFRAYYLEADLKDNKLDFTVDTTLNRRLTPQKFYERDDKPVLVVNCTFFSFATNRNVNVIVKNGDLICYDTSFVKGRGKDSLSRYFTLRSAIGFNKNNEADIAWVAADSSMSYPVAFESPKSPLLLDKYFTKTANFMNDDAIRNYLKPGATEHKILKWKMQTVVGGGPTLLQNGEVKISNEEEMLFAGKAINDKHPRTAMGYTSDGRLIVLAIQGRSESSGGATLIQEAQIFKDLGCWEAMNLDGGGSSCMLVNGKSTIKVSDITGQRPVPAVFIIKKHD